MLREPFLSDCTPKTSSEDMQYYICCMRFCIRPFLRISPYISIILEPSIVPPPTTNVYFGLNRRDLIFGKHHELTYRQITLFVL